MPNTRRMGIVMEERAAQKLECLGYRIIERNFRCRSGEIDIIARHKGYLVFVEVKYRKDAQKGSAAESVNFKKQQTICRVADYYMATHCRKIPSCRFDVVALDGEKLTVYENAFDYIPRGER